MTKAAVPPLPQAERQAVEAVARHFSAPWEPGPDASTATLTVAGRRIALAVASVAGPQHGGTGREIARLRDDRVARRFVSELEAEVEARTPDGRTVILTLGAPIKLPDRTRTALAETLAERANRVSVDVDERIDILGNRARFRILSDGSRWTSKAIGFVFSGDPLPGDLASAMHAVYDAITARSDALPPGASAGDWWLILAAAERIADAKTYRRALSRLSGSEVFEKVLMVSAGRVEVLIE